MSDSGTPRPKPTKPKDVDLETRIPVLLHVATGVRASFTHEQRVR